MNVCPNCKQSHDSTACPTTSGEGLGAMPCSLPCPKCGSGDIYRKIHLQRETWDDWRPRRRENEFVAVDTYSTRAKKDCIQHKCRCCEWVWETAPLSAENVKVLASEGLPAAHCSLPNNQKPLNE